MLFPTDELIFAPSHESSSGVVSTTWGSSPYASMTVAAGEQVVELVGAAELDVGLDGDRVVGLHERVEKLRHRDRLVRPDPLREVVALEDLRDGDRPGEPEHVGEVELREPLPVEAHLGAVAVEDQESLLEVRLRVAVDLLGVEDRTLRSSGPTGRRSASCSRR